MFNKNKNFFLFSVILIFFILLVWQYSSFQSFAAGNAVKNPDAIAVRIIPNPNHYSITRWYASQGFQGSPQILVVDGYEAIRDGRTVYVNAANVKLLTKTIYTNIYLISYNQNPAPNTVDILGQIISHWKFNNNLTNTPGMVTANCAISTLNCSSNADCSANQFCATSGSASSTCLFKTSKDCLTDNDCPTNFFCNSLKSQITRDVKRIGRLANLKIALANFKTTNNHYPLLSAGTYLSGNSVSLWPSWSQVLMANLAVSPDLIDPVNHLGACPGYSSTTCWNQNSKKFFSNPSGSTLVLPEGSQALAYSTNNTGSNYNLCATIESKALGYHFFPNNPVSSFCVIATGITTGGSSTNTAPRLIDKFLTGEASQEFNGFIRVVDADNDPLTWSLNTSESNWTGWYNGSDKPPILKDTSNPSQKKVYAKLAGNPGIYNMTLTVDDGRGGILTVPAPINILASAITINAADAEFPPDANTPLNYSFTFFGNSLTSPASAYKLTKLQGPFDLLAELNKSFFLSNSEYKVNYKGLISTSHHFSKDTAFKYNIAVTDELGRVANKIFTITIVVSKPILKLNCLDATRLNEIYNCLLGSASQNGHTLTYSVSGLMAGLSASGQNISGAPTATSSGKLITVKATNEYGSSASSTYKLRVNNYCGDGIKESPNMEGRGGIYNDGYEDCDGNSGVTTDISQSNINLQYGCQTGVGATTTYPILTNDQCVFKSPVAGGGYCGDGYCQSNNNSLENCNNCAVDCGTCSPPPPPATPPVTISGTVTSYAYADNNGPHYSVPIPGVDITITNAASTTIVKAISAASTGEYSAIIPGELVSSTTIYTATASSTDPSVDYDKAIQPFTPDKSQTIDFTLSTPDYRGVNKIKLTWGDSPKDLDSHLVFGTTNGASTYKYHVWYPNYPNDCHAEASCDCQHVASSSLDIDSRDHGSSGYNYPENIRIRKYVANNYKYYVYNFSKCRNGSTNYFGTAKVTVYNVNNGVIKTYKASSTQSSCYWHVFNIDNNGKITDINLYSNYGPTSRWDKDAPSPKCH